MDFVGLAGLPGQRDRGAASDGSSATYARRYALFTLVGIAGEDDLDAPDLTAPTVPVSGSEKPVTTSKIAHNQWRAGSRGSVYPTKWQRRYGYHKTCAQPASADMKLPCGARPARSCLLSMY